MGFCIASSFLTLGIPGSSSDQAPNRVDLRTPGITHSETKSRQSVRCLVQAYWLPCVIGSVAMWGEVIEHENGWRSDYAAVRRSPKLLETETFRASDCENCAKSTAAQ